MEYNDSLTFLTYLLCSRMGYSDTQTPRRAPISLLYPAALQTGYGTARTLHCDALYVFPPQDYPLF